MATGPFTALEEQRLHTVLGHAGTEIGGVRASGHTSRPELGGGVDAAQAARKERSRNTTTTEEASK
jgi:hypothetical protein